MSARRLESSAAESRLLTNAGEQLVRCLSGSPSTFTNPWNFKDFCCHTRRTCRARFKACVRRGTARRHIGPALLTRKLCAVSSCHSRFHRRQCRSRSGRNVAFGDESTPEGDEPRPFTLHRAGFACKRSAKGELLAAYRHCRPHRRASRAGRPACRLRSRRPLRCWPRSVAAVPPRAGGAAVAPGVGGAAYPRNLRDTEAQTI